MRTLRVIGVAVAAVVAATVAILLAAQLDRANPAPAPRSEAPAAAPTLGTPQRVVIPVIGVDAPLVPVGLRPDGAMNTPEFGFAAWYEPGPVPGQPGPAVVVAHVDSKEKGPDVFHRLRELRAGDLVSVHYPEGTRTFAVTGAEQVAKTKLPAERIWNPTGDPVLRLITCGGAFDRRAGSYLDNVIVYADRLVT
jgi:LPXTG-site transpeptidase (sortase) family protein